MCSLQTLCLCIYISCLFQQHYQNFQLLGAWCLLNSLFLILNLSPTALADKGKEKDPLAALRVRDILSRTKEGVGSPKLGPGKGYVSIRCRSCWFSCHLLLVGSRSHASRLHSNSKVCLHPVPVNNEDDDRSSLSLWHSYVILSKLLILSNLVSFSVRGRKYLCNTHFRTSVRFMLGQKSASIL